MSEDTTEETTPSGEETAKTAEAPAAKVSKKKKGKIKVSKGKVYINSTFNNTIVSITDPTGNVISWSSSGRAGFKGSKKSTPYAGQRAMEDVLTKVKDRGLVEVDVFVKGVGSGRESAVRSLQSSGLTVLSIKDTTPTPHGGVRLKKARRI